MFHKIDILISRLQLGSVLVSHHSTMFKLAIFHFNRINSIMYETNEKFNVCKLYRKNLIIIYNQRMGSEWNRGSIETGKQLDRQLFTRSKDKYIEELHLLDNIDYVHQSNQ